MATRKEKTFEDLFKALSLLNFEIGSHFYAKPTYIVDPHNFFIIPFQFLHHLESLSKPGDPIKPEDIKENIVVIFKSKQPEVNKYIKIDLDNHIRGVIQNIRYDEKKCNIYAFDRGFIEIDVPVDSIFYPDSEEARNTPSLIQLCELDACSPTGPNFTKESIEAFKYYIGNEKLSVVVRGKSVDKLKIMAYNSNPDDIATMLFLTHYTCLSCSVGGGDVEPSSRPDLTYQHIELNVDEVLNVRVQSGTSLNSFYVTPTSAYKKYLRDRGDFTNHCKNTPIIKPEDFKAGAVVGVQDDASHFYERAVIIEVLDPEKATVKLVDWGTEVELPRRRIKALKSEFYLTSPAYALYCSVVDEFVPWHNGLPIFLYKGYSFVMKVKEVGKGFDTPHVVVLAET